MVGERKWLARGVAALLMLAGLMMLAAPTASAHRSDWCKHSDKYGKQWWVAYDYHYNHDFDASRYHYHVTNHFYGPPGGFKKYKHNQHRVCAIYGGARARTDSQAADPVVEAANVATCAGAGMEVNQHFGCGPIVDQDDVAVEQLPGVSDPKLPGPGPLETWLDYVHECRTQYHPLLNPDACDPPIGTVRFVRLARLGGAVLEQPVAAGDAAPCVTAITDRQGRALAPGTRVTVVETAPRAVAAKLGHPC